MKPSKLRLSIRRGALRAPWLRELAAGYLHEYPTISPRRGRGLRGYAFTSGPRRRAGFFVGFRTGKVPECAVFAFVRPAGGRLHARLVREERSLFRRTYELVTKYTARWPRFEFDDEDEAALIRRVPLAAFPPQGREKHARNFFVETLALLQRSGLPERLAQAR